MKNLRTWIVSDGKMGTEKQCIALAEMLGLKGDVKRIEARFPWKYLPPSLWVFALKSLSESRDLLTPPWPDVIIGASRIAAAPLRDLKKKLGKRIKIIFIQNPLLPVHGYDYVIAPYHDKLKGDNVISVAGALAFISKKDMDYEAQKWSQKIPHFSGKKVAIMLGGNSRHHYMDPARMIDEAYALKKSAQQKNIKFLLTSSRRTPDHIVSSIKQILGKDLLYSWDGQGDNPYVAFLGLADFLLVTSDSVSMISEGLQTGKPLYVIELASRSIRLQSFITNLKETGKIRTFEGEWNDFFYNFGEENKMIQKKLIGWISK